LITKHFINRNVKGITTNTGAIAIPSEDVECAIFGAQMNIIGFALRRDRNYFMCYDTNFSAYITTQLTIYYSIII
jgi:hypothetical protein